MDPEQTRAVDNSSWDGGAAMKACESAADYAAICAGRKAGQPSLRSSWALPHHMRPGAPPNAAGVRNALARLPQTQGLTNRAEAQRHLEGHMRAINPEAASAPPTTDLVRAIYPGVELRDAGDGEMPVMVGHFTKYGEWTEINSVREGRFLERIASGAFEASFQEMTPKVLFQHGRDPHIGDKVLGIPSVLREEEEGPWYEVPLLDTSYNREDLIPGIRAGAYGASFRFSIEAEDFIRKPERSDYNPEALPERTVTRARVPEFGPVTFPAYSGATAGIRSMTDRFSAPAFEEELGQYAQDKPGELARLIEGALHERGTEDKPLEDKPPPPDDGGSSPQEPKEARVDEQVQYRTKDEKATRIGVLKSELASIAEEHAGVLPEEAQTRWDAADKELSDLTAALEAQEKREKRISELGPRPGNGEGERPVREFQVRTNTADPYDRAAVYRDSRSIEDANAKFRDNAKRALETTTFPHTRANREDVQGHISGLLDTIDAAGENKVGGELARRILVTGSPAYRRAFAKAIRAGDWNAPMTNEERAIMAEGAGATGGFAITFDLDPTIVPTSNGAVNPFRRVCRVVNISGTNEWRGVSSGAVVATYEAEGTEAVDRSPTLAQPAFIVQRAQTLIDFSIELQQDWGSLVSEMAVLIQDAKDTLEAAQFATGVGTTVFPQGITVGATTTATTGTTTVLAVNDIYKTEEALPPRFRPRAQWFANRFIYNKVRQLDTAGGANLWVQDLRQGLANNETGNTGYNLIGYPANEASGMAASLATTTKLAVLGDPNYYVIVERVGMDVELIPHLFGTTANYPTGRRGLYAMWRNTARVFENEGFITLVGL